MSKINFGELRRQAKGTLFEKGMAAAALGLVLVLLSLVMGISAMAAMLWPVGWVLVGSGLAVAGWYLSQHGLPRAAQKAGGRNKSHNTQRAALAASPRSPKKTSREPAPPRPQITLLDAPVSIQPPPDSQIMQSGYQSVEWNLKVFSAIEWRRFEAVCETLFAQGGFQARIQQHGTDNGVDIWLYSKNVTNSALPAAVVQCKHWRGKPVTIKEMTEFFEVMNAFEVQRGIFATTSTFTREAVEFAKVSNISTLDGAGLLALIGTRTLEQQKTLLDIAYEGEYWRPTCVMCGVKMVDRRTKHTGVRFWGCQRFPQCHHTLKMAKSA